VRELARTFPLLLGQQVNDKVDAADVGKATKSRKLQKQLPVYVGGRLREPQEIAIATHESNYERNRNWQHDDN
jgi:hypothetical protein